ncbi:tape measure protein [Limosilactobacillus reuteri]|uniref:tape measure protein n=1 Tax=Limosilactobacillus reuteri TaxID=1598 RepID=UPI00117EE0D9|nr:tape measure protein [Limosilactobacillus reuteri]MCT3212410.1 lytic transglycosylase [Limosilactobacillus reuteri]TSB20815.1 lytic transglycosylase [Limosilactobacillus reuteri]UAW61546.1 lytic transglycosylase [Limosilactobacillus reuteri]
MSSPVVTKEFWWKFRDGITQEVAKARQIMSQAADEIREEGSKIASTGEDWKKVGDKAKEAAQDTSQAVSKAKENAESMKNAAQNAAESIRGQFKKTTEVINGIPKEKVFNLKAKFDDDKLKTFSRKINDVPEQKSIWLKIKDGFSNSLKNAQQDADNTKKSFSNLREVMTGTFLGNAVLNGIYAIGNGLKGLIATGYQYTRQQQTMIASWNTLTGSASKGQEMVDMTNKLAISAQNSTEMVNDLNQKFYAVTNSAGKTKELSQSVLTLQDAFNASDASIENFSTQWAQMVGNGKASAQDMLSIQNVFPKFRQELLAYEREATHNKNLTMQQMNDMMSQGKISSKAMNEVLIGMGHKYQDATKNFTSTLDGMGRIIKTTAPRLLGAMVEPFTKAQNPIYKAVSNWVSDRGTQKKFNELGKTMSNGISKIMTAFAGKGNSTRGIENGLNRSFDSITNKVKTAADTIAKNANNIKQVFSIINSISSIAFKSVGAAIMDVANIFGIFGSKSEKARSPLSAIAGLLRGIADNKAAIQALGVVMLSVFTVNKYMAFTKWLTELKKTMLFTETVSVLKTLKTGFTSLASVGIRALGGLISGTKELTVANAALDIALSPITWIVTAVVALGVAFYEAYKHIKPFRDVVNKTGEAIKKLFTGKYDWEQSFGKGLSKLGKSFQNFAKKIPQFFKGVGKAIIKTIVIGLALPVGIGITLMKPLIKPLQNSTKSLIKTVQKQWQSFSKWLGKLFDPVAKLWNRVWNGWARIFSTVWKSLKKTASSGMKAIERLIGPAVKAIEKVWVTSWNSIASFFSGIWHTITSLGGNGMRMLHSAIAGPLNTISSIWHSVWNSISSFFRGIWNGIKQAAQDGMNGVINVINAGIGGINKVWSFFTGHGTGVKELGHVHFAQGGTVHRHLSVINDGDGPDWKELVQTPDGNLFMSQERNWTGFLPEGTRVYSGAETRQIMNAVGVSHYATGGIVGAQHFADGGIIGEGIDWAKGSLENIGSWLGDKFSALEDFLADPLKATKGLLEKATSGMYKGLGNFANIAHGAMNKLTQPIADWFKKGLEKLEAQFESGGASPDLIRAAAAKMHVAISGGDISHIMNVIKHESGGNARAINNWDSNAKAGHPSKGILQFIDGTFRKYAVAGHTNIYSPFDQLLAMFNDTTWRSDLTLGGWGPTGGRRFATGGEVFGLTNAIIGDNPEHHEFVLNPYAVSAEPLLDKAFEATAQAQPATQGTATSGNSKLDVMIDLLAKMVERLDNIDPDVILDGESIRKRNNKENAKDLSRIGR